MKYLNYHILCCCLLLAATGSVQVQAQCRNKFVQVSLGLSHALAVADDGTLWAWGSNSYGQLGIGNTTSQSTPVQVGTDRNWKQVKAGTWHSMAVKTNGTLWAWGENEYDQLGIGNTTDQQTPVQVGTDTDWDLSGSGLVGNGPSGALKTNGSLWFWGYEASASVPTQEPTLARDWKKVVSGSGSEHTFAIKTNGTLWEVDANVPPLQVGTATDWKTLAAGYNFQLAIRNDGTLWSWGDNSYGELGNGGIGGHQDLPTQVGTDRDWKEVSASFFTSYALKNDGSLWSWGRGDTGGLSDGTLISRGVPTRVGWGYESVTTGGNNAMAFRFDGSLWGWGSEEMGKLLEPQRISGGNIPLFPTLCHNPAFITGLSFHDDAETLTSTNYRHYFEKDCRLICAVEQTNNWGNGVQATGNSIRARVWVDAPQPVQYCKRHYQINPTFNPETTTGRVRLYFTQAEFDAFNAVATNIKKLPTRPRDAAGIANLRVEKRGGTSASGSGNPASYPGAAQTIDPEDTDIRWDAANRRWEVEFEVTGFGGFWVKTTDLPLPVIFGKVAAYQKGGNLFVDWTAQKEINNHHYEIEAGRDGKTFTKIGELPSKAANGNSDTAIEYRFQTPITGLLGAVGMAALALAAGTGTRRRRLPVAIIAITLLGAAACVKKSKDADAIGGQKIWVRIAQVDKDGTKQYSKIVKVITGD